MKDLIAKSLREKNTLEQKEKRAALEKFILKKQMEHERKNAAKAGQRKLLRKTL